MEANLIAAVPTFPSFPRRENKNHFCLFIYFYYFSFFRLLATNLKINWGVEEEEKKKPRRRKFGFRATDRLSLSTDFCGAFRRSRLGILRSWIGFSPFDASKTNRKAFRAPLKQNFAE